MRVNIHSHPLAVEIEVVDVVTSIPATEVFIEPVEPVYLLGKSTSGTYRHRILTSRLWQAYIPPLEAARPAE